MSGDTIIEDIPPTEPVPDTEEISILKEHFKMKFDAEPDFYTLAPGRVNLIGEHIDYCGFSVCPMAVEQHILIAFKVSDDCTVRLTNVENDKYKDFECSINDISISVDGIPEWYQYFLCAVKGMSDLLPPETAPTGFYAAVTGNIPPRSGLSSSSALVSAATLALAYAFNQLRSKSELAEIAAKCERYIGTQGGGMDQAIAFLATKGYAKLISFNPLSSEDIKLPDGAVFVIANSLVEMNKAATNDFNTRVVECRLAAQILGNDIHHSWKRFRRLSDVKKNLTIGVPHLRAMAMEMFHEKPYTKQEICRELRARAEEVDKESLTENTKHLKEFKLKPRLQHVVEEVFRVQEFTRHCKEFEHGSISSSDCLWYLGKLMQNSHKDLKNLYECSHEELDKIVAIAEEYTYGGRLTGAGWGGCTVAIADKEKAQKYITALKEKFYANNASVNGQDLDTLVFSSEPGRGAVIYTDRQNSESL